MQRRKQAVLLTHNIVRDIRDRFRKHVDDIHARSDAALGGNEICDARNILRQKMTLIKLFAKETGVSIKTIRDCLVGRTWYDIDDVLPLVRSEIVSRVTKPVHMGTEPGLYRSLAEMHLLDPFKLDWSVLLDDDDDAR